LPAVSAARPVFAAVRRLIEQRGRDIRLLRLLNWLCDLTADCPRKHSPGLADPCRALYPQLPALFG